MTATDTRKPIPRNRRAESLVRLNGLLRFADDDLAVLTNGQWEEKLDELYFYVYGRSRSRGQKLSMFNRLATRESVREAQIGLKRAVGDPRHPETFTLLTGPTSLASGAKEISFALGKQTLTIHESPDGSFESWFTTEHFPTIIFMAFEAGLRLSAIKRSDIRNCDDRKCPRLFVPLRKPHKGKPAYCSPKCANRVAAITYRQRKRDELKAKEKSRSKKRYDAKWRKKYPGAKIGREGRKPG